MNESDADISEAVLRYLAENPLAMDTVDGIAEWWLTRQRVHTSMNTLARVLRDMTRSGVLEEIGPGDPPRYRLRRPKNLKGGNEEK